MQRDFPPVGSPSSDRTPRPGTDGESEPDETSRSWLDDTALRWAWLQLSLIWEDASGPVTRLDEEPDPEPPVN
jgi:hypothetical protein